MAEPPGAAPEIDERLLQPGPDGVPPVEQFLAAVDALAAQDPAAGWLCAVVNVGAQLVAEHGAEVWGDAPPGRVVVGGATPGRLVRDGAGWSLSGQWPAIVGAQRADWLLLAADAGRRVLVPCGDVSIGEAETVGVATGLTSAGIGAVRVAELAVPAHRVWSISDRPGAEITGAAAAAAVIGSAHGVWQTHVEQVRRRLAMSYGSAESGDQAVSAQRVARVASDLDLARLHIVGSVRQSAADAAWAQRQAVGRARTAADQLLADSRRYALDADDPVSRSWRDVHAGCAPAFGLIGFG